MNKVRGENITVKAMASNKASSLWVTMGLLFVTNLMVIISADALVYKGDGNKRLNVDIADSGVNRIEVKKDRIAKVIGNTEEYSIEGDNKTGVIFLSVRGIAGQVLPITIITEKGYTQDINLKVKKANEPKSIIIEKQPPKEKNQVSVNKKDLKEQVIEAIKQISNGVDRNYTKREIQIKEIINYEKQQKMQDNLEENSVYKGYATLRSQQVEVSRVIEYNNRTMKIIKYEYERKPSNMDIKKISQVFKGALSVSERGNVIMVVYQS